MSGPSRIPDWNLLTVERHTDFDVTETPEHARCTECDGDGQTGMYADGSPMVCDHCGGSGKEPTADELARREDERYAAFFGDLEEDDAA